MTPPIPQALVIGSLTGLVTGMIGSAFNLSTWDYVGLILLHCTALSNGMTRVGAE